LHDFASFGVFDVIFCRNVLIYFDQQTKVNIFNRLAKMTAPDGYFVLGAAESVVGLTDVFHPCLDRRGLYRPKAVAASPAKAAAAAMPIAKTAAMARP